MQLVGYKLKQNHIFGLRLVVSVAISLPFLFFLCQYLLGFIHVRVYLPGIWKFSSLDHLSKSHGLCMLLICVNLILLTILK